MTNSSPFDVMTIDCAGEPFLESQNGYSCFEKMIEKFGIYVFQDKGTNQILYVGEAYKQDLKTRITQNYTAKNTGGTFRKNYCETEDKSFKDFKGLLSGSSIKAISIDTDSKVLIGAIEAILISALKPKYNK